MTIHYTKLLALSAAFLLVSSLGAQNTVGLIQNDALLAQDGYTLLFPHAQKNVYLLDNCGRIVHQWEDTVYVPGNGVYLMDNGDLLRCGKRQGVVNPIINEGGAGEVVERRDWNGNLLWRFTYNSPTYRLHHDIQPLPNGNVLMIAWELKTMAEAVAAGKDTAGFQETSVWPDKIIEVEPIGLDSGNIVWEWHAWDHLIQNFDPTKANYGAVEDHPELINLNYGVTEFADWMHANGIHYNAALDQIVLSVPHFNEIWVIDHSTTTAEAAGSTGGNSGKGGDLLYRYGNPDAYRRGSPADQKLFFNHDARWVEAGIPNDPDDGNIMIFNNRAGSDFSRVDMITPPMDSAGNYVIQPNLPFGPDTLTWSFVGPMNDTIFSGALSGAHKLPNGNFLITAGTEARLVEITRMGQPVWEYVLPLQFGQPVAQGATPTNANANFRSTKYPANHPFLVTQNLTPIGYIELQPDTVFCGSISTGTEEFIIEEDLVYPNPTTGLFQYVDEVGVYVRITDVLGQVVKDIVVQESPAQIDITSLPAGPYLLHSSSGKTTRIIKE